MVSHHEVNDIKGGVAGVAMEGLAITIDDCTWSVVVVEGALTSSVDHRNSVLFQKLLVGSALKKVSRQLCDRDTLQQLLTGKIKRGEATDSDIDQWFANEPTVAWLEWLWNRLMGYEQDRSPFDFDLWKVADLSTTDLATAILQDKLPLDLSHYKPLRATKQVS